MCYSYIIGNISMVRRSRNIIVDLVLFVLGYTANFIKEAYRAGRLVELLISGPLLIGAYWLLYLFRSSVYWWVFLLPISVFSFYWYYLFQHEKITSLKADPNWANRDWWWTLDGWEFEEETAKIFRLNGYRAKVTQKTSDGGIDLLMHKDKDRIIVQCKHYQQPVGVSVVRELNGLKDDFKADKLILVASSGVTKSAEDFIKNTTHEATSGMSS